MKSDNYIAVFQWSCGRCNYSTHEHVGVKRDKTFGKRPPLVLKTLLCPDCLAEGFQMILYMESIITDTGCSVEIEAG